MGECDARRRQGEQRLALAFAAGGGNEFTGGSGDEVSYLVEIPATGIWYLWAADYNTSVAVWVGFIALAGVAAETGVVMLLYLDEAYREHRRRAGAAFGRADLAAAVREGAVERLRPKLMTVLTIILGLAPIMWSRGTGADVMQRIAAPMVGGMVTSTVLTLVVIPSVYLLWKRGQLRDA